MEDIKRGWRAFRESGRHVCFSVVRGRKNRYFNMVERDAGGVKKLERPVALRLAAPAVYEMNAFYTREFLLSKPCSLWEGKPEIFEMGPETAFDINEERDFPIAELMMQRLLNRGSASGPK